MLDTRDPQPQPAAPPAPGTAELETLDNFQFSFMELGTCCHLLLNVQCKSAFTFMVLINLIINLACQLGVGGEGGRRWGWAGTLPAEACGFGTKPVSEPKTGESHGAVVQ